MNGEKAAVLIDNQYLIKEVLDNKAGRNGNFRLDYEKFSDLLCRNINAERFRTYVYDAEAHSNHDFLTSLNLINSFEIRLGELQDSDKGPKQKQVDVLITLDMVKLALKNKIQHIILITGDGDFVPAVKFVKEEGVKVHLMRSEKTYSRELSQICDTRGFIDDTVLVEWKEQGRYPR